MNAAHPPRTLRRIAATATIGTMIAALLALWAWTWRKDTRDLEKLDRHLAQGKHLVAVFWHGKYFSLFALARGRQATVVTTRSFRGDVIARICRWFGYHPIQIEHGVETNALASLENDLTGNHALAAIAVDGPRGPAHRPKTGALRVASDLGFRLIPISVAGTPRYIVENRWDKHEVPLPFARVRLTVGDPFEVPHDLSPGDMAEWETLLRDRLEEIDPAKDLGIRANRETAGRVRNPAHREK